MLFVHKCSVRRNALVVNPTTGRSSFTKTVITTDHPCLFEATQRRDDYTVMGDLEQEVFVLTWPHQGGSSEWRLGDEIYDITFLDGTAWHKPDLVYALRKVLSDTKRVYTAIVPYHTAYATECGSD